MKLSKLFKSSAVTACFAFAALAVTSNAYAGPMPVCESLGDGFIGIERVVPSANYSTTGSTNVLSANVASGFCRHTNLVYEPGSQLKLTIRGQVPLTQTTVVSSPTGVIGSCVKWDSNTNKWSFAPLSGVAPTLCGTPVPASRFIQIAKASGLAPVTECFKDTVTGLTWEGKPSGGARSTAKTNFDDANRLQIPDTPTATTYRKPTQLEIDAGTNSIGYKTTVNGSSLCGLTNWRIPNLAEVTALYAALGGSGSAAMTAWLPNVKTWYQTSSIYNNNTVAYDEHFVMGFNFASGQPNHHGRNLNYQMILVSP